jgi:hypothetical protein
MKWICLILVYLLIGCNTSEKRVSWKESSNGMKDSAELSAYLFDSNNSSINSKNRKNIPKETEVLTFDWNGDGVMDSVIFNGVKTTGTLLNWEQTIIKISGRNPLVIGDEPQGDYLFQVAKELIDKDEYIKMNDKSNSPFAVKMAVDGNPKHDIILLWGWGFFDGSILYIIKLDRTGSPKLVYDKQQENISFNRTTNTEALTLTLPYESFINLEEFYYDSTTNGPVPDSYCKLKNSKGNILESYNPSLVYRFGADSLEIDSALSKSYNLKNNHPWVSTSNPFNYVVFFDNKNSKPKVYKREDFIKKWEALNR